jgi:hypothetical protein
MASGLRLADDLALPIDAVTETFLIFGKRGVGKTSTGTVLAEELIEAGQPVCVLDPKGDWWGLRSSADGQGPGLPVTILGGDHADLPLDPKSGTAVAELVASERLPVVLDMSLMSKTQQRAFVTDFMERLYRVNREPLHLIIDEADRFAPQRADRDMARLLGAYEDIVLRGRKFGIGSTSITLRPAQLNSAIRSQVEVLIAMRLLGKLDVDAINEWISVQASEEDARDLKATMPKMPVGTAWFWSPGWLEIMQKVQVRPRRTFDSSATPKVGERLIEPRQFAPVNPGDLERMAELLGRDETLSGDAATAGEVKRLSVEVARLRAELAQAQGRPPERVEVPTVSPGDIAVLLQAASDVRDAAVRVELALSPASTRALVQPCAPTPRPHAALQPTAKAPEEVPTTPTGDVTLSKAQRAVLTVLAQFPDGRTKSQVATLSGYAVKSSSLDNALSGLRSAGLVQRGTPIRITAEGAAVIGDSLEPLPSGPALVEYWMSRLGKAERLLLKVFLGAWPSAVSREDAAEQSGYSIKSSSFDNALSRLRTLELIHGWTADETLAEQAAIETGGTSA